MLSEESPAVWAEAVHDAATDLSLSSEPFRLFALIYGEEFLPTSGIATVVMWPLGLVRYCLTVLRREGYATRRFDPETGQAVYQAHPKR